jgi:glycosyltransferase involved in cell wall biosynthesis
MRSEPLVSVVIPTLDRANRVVRAIDSVIAQTYPRIEVIVVDDGSTDGTQDALAAYGARIRVLRQDNQGVSAARNAGIAASRGRWIALLDSDDEWLPEKLARQLQQIEQSNADPGVCFCDCTMVDGSSADQTLFGAADFRRGAQSSNVLERAAAVVLARHSVIHTSSVLIDRRLLEPAPVFDANLRVAEDTDLLFRLALRTNFCVVDEPLVRVHVARDPSVPRLTDVFAERRDEGYRDRVTAIGGWRPLVASDRTLRRRVDALYRSTYVDWVFAKWRSGQRRAAWQLILRARRGKSSTAALLGSLMVRSIRGVARRVGLGTPADTAVHH